MKTTDKIRSTLLVGLVLMLALTTCGTATPAEEPGLSAEALASAEEYFRQGNELSQAGDFAKAAEAYETALEFAPDDVDAMSNLGVAYYSLGELDRAIEQYTKAIELAPNDADIHSNLAAAYVQKHQTSGAPDQLDKALEEYQKAVELNPNLAQAFFGLGVVNAVLGQNDAAIEAFERFQELDTGQDPMATSNADEYLKKLRGQ